MKFLLSLLYTPTVICSTTMPVVIQTANNLNKNTYSEINIRTLQESFISFYNTMLLETKTQLNSVKFLFSETETSVKNLVDQLEEFANLDVSETDDAKIVSYFNKMTNNYEQFLRILLSIYDDSQTYALKNVSEDILQTYDADSTVRLYTRALNSSYRKLTYFFDDNIEKITKILENDRLLKFYNSTIKDQEIANPEEYPLILTDIEYLTRNLIKDMTKKSYTSNLSFSKWYDQLQQMIADTSKNKSNAKAYYYVPKDDNSHWNKLKNKIDNDIESNIKKINDHLQLGKDMEILESFGNSVNKISPVVTNKLDYLYEVEVKITVRRGVLINSDIKEINLDRIKIEAIGSYAQEKLNESSKLKIEADDLQSKWDNLEITGTKFWSNNVSGTSEWWTFVNNSEYVGHVKDFELTKLEIVVNSRIHFWGDPGGKEYSINSKVGPITLDSLTSSQKADIATVFATKGKVILTISTDCPKRNQNIVTFNFKESSDSGKTLFSFEREGWKLVNDRVIYCATAGSGNRRVDLSYVELHVKWKHKTDLDIDKLENQSKEKLSQKENIDNEIKYIETNFRIKK